MIDINYRNNRFILDERPNITIITGDSATGKTLFFNAVRNQIKLKNKQSKFIVIDLNNNTYIEDIIQNNKDKIIVIDEANTLLKPGDMLEINKYSRNKYIIIGRGKRLNKLRITPWDVMTLKFDPYIKAFILESVYNLYTKEV